MAKLDNSKTGYVPKKKYKKKTTPFLTFVKVVIIVMFLIMILFTIGSMISPLLH